jgi:hypothetical protein
MPVGEAYPHGAKKRKVGGLIFQRLALQAGPTSAILHFNGDHTCSTYQPTKTPKTHPLNSPLSKETTMKFTSKELQQIERTMDKLVTASTALLSRESTDYANVRALSYIIGELRVAAALISVNDGLNQQHGTERVLSLFAELPVTA